MPYDRLRCQLEDTPSPAVATLPDGSVDHYATIATGGEAPLNSREALAEQVADGRRSSFRLQVESREPGGQAVNAATQVHALGGQATCYGHLDHPIFAEAPYETVSMGEPATVYAFNFTDGDVMLAENTHLAGWRVADLTSVAPLETVFDANAVCCGNWVTFRGLSELFHRLGGADVPRVPFVVDPGDIVGTEAAALAELFEALTALQSAVDVIYSVNRGEIRESAAALGVEGDTDRECLTALRAAADLQATVLHAPDEAVAATVDGVSAVPTPPVDKPARFTGGGDRFDGGLAVALAEGWDWPTALACGNACASHFVGSGETAEPADLRAVATAMAAD